MIRVNALLIVSRGHKRGSNIRPDGEHVSHFQRQQTVSGQICGQTCSNGSYAASNPQRTAHRPSGSSGSLHRLCRRLLEDQQCSRFPERCNGLHIQARDAHSRKPARNATIWSNGKSATRPTRTTSLQPAAMPGRYAPPNDLNRQWRCSRKLS